MFHLHGALGFCWAVLWVSTAADGPSDDKRCSAGERSYIEATLAAVRRHDIAAIWVAFFSRCQRYRCGQEAAACATRVQGEATAAGKQKETTAAGSGQVLAVDPSCPFLVHTF